MVLTLVILQGVPELVKQIKSISDSALFQKDKSLTDWCNNNHNYGTQ